MDISIIKRKIENWNPKTDNQLILYEPRSFSYGLVRTNKVPMQISFLDYLIRNNPLQWQNPTFICNGLITKNDIFAVEADILVHEKDQLLGFELKSLKTLQKTKIQEPSIWGLAQAIEYRTKGVDESWLVHAFVPFLPSKDFYINVAERSLKENLGYCLFSGISALFFTPQGKIIEL